MSAVDVTRVEYRGYEIIASVNHRHSLVHVEVKKCATVFIDHYDGVHVEFAINDVKQILDIVEAASDND